MYVFGLLIRRLWLLMLVGLIVGASCAGITKLVEEPTYTSSMTFIVNNKSEKDLSSSGDNSVSYNDMSASAYMANTFVHLMTGRTMCNAIAAECKAYPKTADEVEEMIAASRKTDSSIIDMTVTAGSPEEAYELAQAVKDTYKDVVQVYSGGSIHLCDMPELPTEPDKSVGITRNAIIGALAGAVICALIIIIRDSARNTVRSQEDIQNKLQLNVIGEVSQVPGGERVYKKSAHGDRKLLITDKACGFAFIETYKAMRTKLELLNGRRGYKSFVISSAGANEGKTTVAVNLSLALAQNGYSVLLIDADLRKPSVLKNLGITNISGNGIADVVGMVKNSSDAIKYIEKYKIFVLAGDECIADPTEVLSNAKTGEFIAAAKEKFDYIIIDTPPAGIVADAAICAKYTDSSIFVIREDRFPVPAILEAVSDLTQGGTTLPAASTISLPTAAGAATAAIPSRAADTATVTAGITATATASTTVTATATAVMPARVTRKTNKQKNYRPSVYESKVDFLSFRHSLREHQLFQIARALIALSLGYRPVLKERVEHFYLSLIEV